MDSIVDMPHYLAIWQKGKLNNFGWGGKHGCKVQLPNFLWTKVINVVTCLTNCDPFRLIDGLTPNMFTSTSHLEAFSIASPTYMCLR
jgi:hypothetical protein